MKLTTNDCKQYIVDWYANNRNALSINKREWYGDWVGDGLDPKDWKRCAKSSSNGKTYRAFEPGTCTVIDVRVVIVLTEENGVIVKLEHCERDQFEGPGNYFNRIKWNGLE